MWLVTQSPCYVKSQTGPNDQNTSGRYVLYVFIMGIRPKPNVELFMRRTNSNLGRPKLSQDRLLGQI